MDELHAAKYAQHRLKQYADFFFCYEMRCTVNKYISNS